MRWEQVRKNHPAIFDARLDASYVARINIDIQKVIDPKQNPRRRAVLILDNVSGISYPKDPAQDAPYRHAVEIHGPQAASDPTQQRH